MAREHKTEDIIVQYNKLEGGKLTLRAVDVLAAFREHRS